MQVSTNRRVLVLEVLLLLRALTTFVPAAEEFFPIIVNAFVVFAIYALLISLAGMNFVVKTFCKFIPLYLITIAVALWGYRSSNVITFLYGTVQWTLWPIAITFIVKKRYTSMAHRFYYFSLIFILITCITTYFGNINFPNASRDLAAIWSEDSDRAHLYRTMNIGDFEFVYLLVLMIPVWIYTIKSKANLYKKSIAIAAIIVAFYTIIETQYTTALLFSIVSLILFFTPPKFHMRTLFLYIFAMVFFVLVFTSLISSVLSNFADTTERSVIAERIEGLSDIMEGKSTYGDTESRQKLMLMSWESFKNNLITGSGKVGGHSLILDTMGHFGLLGIVFLLIVLVGLFRLCVKPYWGGAFYGYLLFTYISQLALALLNTQIIFLFFFIIAPIIAIDYNSNQNDNNIRIV